MKIIYIAMLLSGMLALSGCESGTTSDGRIVGTLNPFKKSSDKVEGYGATDFGPSQVKAVAVLWPKFENRNQAEDEAEVTLRPRSINSFMQILMSKGYRVVEFAQVESIISQYKWQRSGFTEADAARIGKALNATHVVIVNVSLAVQTGFSRQLKTQTFASSVECNARMIDVESHVVCYSASKDDSFTTYTIGDVITRTVDNVKEVARAFPGVIQSAK